MGVLDLEDDDDDDGHLCKICLDEEDEGWPYLPIEDETSLEELINVEALLYAASKYEIDDMWASSADIGYSANDSINNTRALDLKNWDTLLFSLQNRLYGILEARNRNDTAPSTAKLLDNLVQETTLKMEFLLQEATTTMLHPVTGLEKTTKTMLNPITTGSEKSVPSPEVVIQGLAKQLTANAAAAAQSAVAQAYDTANDNTKGVYDFANDVLFHGWHSKEKSLFNDDEDGGGVREVQRSHALVRDAADMAVLAGAIYLPERWQKDVQGSLKHSIVANGTARDVSFLVTDSIRAGKLVRTVTIRGFDATDGGVDRERLLEKILTAWPQKINIEKDKDLYVHSGLLDVAEGLYVELMKYVEGLADGHKVILNGHSIGGSLSVLLMMIMAREKGVKYVKSKIHQIYTFGAPPITKSQLSPPTDVHQTSCPILSTLSLPPNFILSFVQPWDPIIRLFSRIDPLYPLVDDIGPDGVTLYASGPQRTLRPMLRTIFENWEKWPTLRSSMESLNQFYTPVGTCYFILPETTRYLTDRLVNVFVEVPPVHVILEVQGDGEKTLQYLERVFPLDEFRISFVPVALRSFVHHFFPAYSESLSAYSNKGRDKDNNDADDLWSPEKTMKKYEPLLKKKKLNKPWADSMAYIMFGGADLQRRRLPL
eukprot:CAMPEP_0172491484 /NCGR_PEP_ID=MMETSP1066-20121228/22329_1 /TAXON_ID=671091 /ORGANISM="Coscinodiscus wailesii, Strain CCMP2513" /LENGTH=654 /DNA_ID=CAMNT_0013260557 /DNA_START=479 /DNA_END=2443 /DNA_ORIENTATION=-